jgi:hypothetical protein
MKGSSVTNRQVYFSINLGSSPITASPYWLSG